MLSKLLGCAVLATAMLATGMVGSTAARSGGAAKKNDCTGSYGKKPNV